jgi:hypothetical protein
VAIKADKTKWSNGRKQKKNYEDRTEDNIKKSISRDVGKTAEWETVALNRAMINSRTRRRGIIGALK